MEEKKSTNFCITKSNALNECAGPKMTMEQLRLEAAYCAAIDPRRESTRLVRISVREYAALFGRGRVRPERVAASGAALVEDKASAKALGEGAAFFGKFEVSKGESGEAVIEMECSDQMASHLFGLKGNYTMHRLGEEASLRTPNSLRLFQLLSQYRNVGRRRMGLAELKAAMGIGEGQYEEWRGFRSKVLLPAQSEINSQECIPFTFEFCGVKGAGRKTAYVEFTMTAKAKRAERAEEAKRAERAEEAKRAERAEEAKRAEGAAEAKRAEGAEEAKRAEAGIPEHGPSESLVDQIAEACKEEFSRHTAKLAAFKLGGCGWSSKEIVSAASEMYELLCFRDYRNSINSRPSYYLALVDLKAKGALGHGLPRSRRREKMDNDLEYDYDEMEEIIYGE